MLFKRLLSVFSLRGIERAEGVGEPRSVPRVGGSPFRRQCGTEGSASADRSYRPSSEISSRGHRHVRQTERLCCFGFRLNPSFFEWYYEDMEKPHGTDYSSHLEGAKDTNNEMREIDEAI